MYIPFCVVLCFVVLCRVDWTVYSLYLPISINFSEVDSDLPQDIRDEALMCFEAAVSNRMSVGDAIQKVQKDVLSKCDERFKGQRYKGFIKFDFDTNVISITVSKNLRNNSMYKLYPLILNFNKKSFF